MRTLLMTLALFALVCAGCGDKEDDAAPDTGVENMKDAAGGAMKDAGKKAAEIEFTCEKCGGTKSAAKGDPPS